ncbi:MAG: ATP-binding protein [Nitrospirales bacterium]|nr:ATP-binding protein [Nitrospirales bacterium]
MRFLESRWHEESPQLIVLWGKRRVGKTELVKQFLQGKPHIYFLGESTSETQQIRRFSDALAAFYKDPLLETRGFTGWEEAFRFLAAKNEKLLIAVDEFPYLIESNPAIPSLFQKAWDEYWAKGSLYVILLGSSMAMMENEVLGYRSPLYGRRTGQWHVDPMPFSSVGKFREGKPFADRIAHYAVAGGIPAYWLQLSPEKGYEKNLSDHVLKKGEMLYDEVEFILREELREPRYYFAILQAIAQGKRKLSEIVNATGISQPVANKYLSVLADLRIVERELPVTEDKPLKSKKGLYRITDEFFLFWFRFIFPRRGELEMGLTKEVLEQIKRDLPQHLGAIYEKVAIETVRQNRERFFPFQAVGRWWEQNEEIDLVAFNKDQDSILFGEVKWSEKQVGTNIYEELKEKARKVQWGSKTRKEHYCLFSKKGFTSGMMQLARKEGVFLFEEDRLI